jgi:hypothetical protein
MDVHLVMLLKKGLGMENAFNRRIRVGDGFARPVLEISRADADGGRLWIPSAVQSFSETCPGVSRSIAF